MFIARWQIEARFGYKQAALDSMKKWIKEVGSKVGWKADRVRVITGSIGANESTIETEIVIKELRELDEAWAKLAKLYANDDQVVFGLMNEPNTMPVAQWVDAANAATDAIRNKAGAKNLILVPGTAWTGAHSWLKPIDGEPNGVALKDFHDPGNNFAFEVHQYFDDDFSGTKGNCSRAKDAVAAVENFTDWLKSNGYRGMLGEFGAPKGEACVAAIRAMVDVVERNKDVWTGWTYWVAGDWWSPEEPLNIQPTKDGDRPMLQALMPALRDLSATGSSCPALN